MFLDTAITDELKEEGMARDLIRAVQEARKAFGFSPNDKINLEIQNNSVGKLIVDKFGEIIQKTVLAENLNVLDFEGGEAVAVGGEEVRFIVKPL